MKMKRKFLLLAALIVCLCGCSSERTLREENHTSDVTETETVISDKDIAEHIEKGYDLPVSDMEREEAENDCKKQMDLIADIYTKADKGSASNVVLSNETLEKMASKMKENGCSVRIGDTYSNMENYEKFEDFLKACVAGKQGEAVIYEIHWDGGLCREKYIFDGEDVYVLIAGTVWNNANKAVISYVSYTRLKEWRNTESGWFCYELCVPEYPEVTEVVDGSCLVRVKPISKENREMSEKCVLGIGYQGNNLLCSDWDADNMDNLDYNGLYEYLYAMKYEQKFNPEKYSGGIPKEEFESLIMEYLPITSEKLQEYAVFDDKSQKYRWEPLGCGNHAPNFFGTSVPEVVNIKENADGTVTLTVNAVCDMVLCDDAVITHELTLKFRENGSFQYLSNKILGDGLNNVPEYQYRLK